MGNTCCGNRSELENDLYGYLYSSKIRKLKFSNAKAIIDYTFPSMYTRKTKEELLDLNSIISNQLRKLLAEFYIDRGYLHDDYQKQEIYVTSLFQEFSPNKYLLLFIYFSLYNNDENKLNLFLPMLQIYSNSTMNYIEFYQYVKEYLTLNLILSHRVNKTILDLDSQDLAKTDEIFTIANLENFMRKLFSQFEGKHMQHAESYLVVITQQHVNEVFGRFAPGIFDFFELQKLFVESLED
jgi:hypothetical protein